MTNNIPKGTVKANQGNNLPFVSINPLYEFLRFNDYSAQNGLGEFIDNSVEAGAMHVVVYTTTEKIQKGTKRKPVSQITEITVVDDGCGMSRDTLRKCLALGESTCSHGGKLGIGRFGVGMTMGGISLARRIEVYSRVNPDEDFLYTFIDLDNIQSGIMQQIPEPIVQVPPTDAANLLKNSSGTVVVLKKCDRIDGNVDFSNFLGQTYRKFIEHGVEISLNGEKVYLHDPLYMASPTIFDACRLQTEDSIEPKAISLGEFRIPREIPGTDGKMADVVIRMSLLPKEWRTTQSASSSVEAKKRKIDRNEGISVLRADREIFYGHIPYITEKKGEAKPDEKDCWWGCEISFPPELDDDFQVRYLKRGAEPTPDLRDQIRAAICDVIRTARTIIQEDWNANNVEMRRQEKDFGKAEEAMAKATQGLPRSKRNKNISETGNDEAKKKPFSIELVNYPKNVLFETVHLQNRIIIELNVNHPFYKNVLQPLCEDLADTEWKQEREDIKNAITLLLLSYARAESLFDNHEELFESLCEQWSITLAAALSEYERTTHE